MLLQSALGGDHNRPQTRVTFVIVPRPLRCEEMPAHRIHLERNHAVVVPERGLIKLRNADGDPGATIFRLVHLSKLDRLYQDTQGGTETQAIKVAQACPKLRAVEVDIKRKYDDFMILDDEARYEFRELRIGLLRPSSWALRLQKLCLFTSDMTLLTMVIPSPLTGNILDCITAGHIDFLHAAFPSFGLSAKGTAFTCVPALQRLEVGNSTLYEVGYTKTVRGAMTTNNVYTFTTACEVHCTGWSGPLHSQKTLLSSVKPLSTIKSWIAELPLRNVQL